MSVDGNDLDRLERAMIRVIRGSRQRTARRSSGLVGAGYLLLTCLEQRGPARLSDLAAILRLDASTVSRQVRWLRDAGLVRRVPDPDDGRASRVLLSDLGRAELALQGEERHAMLAAAVSGWDKADRATLVGLLERLAEDIEAPREPAPANQIRETQTRETQTRQTQTRQTQTRQTPAQVPGAAIPADLAVPSGMTTTTATPDPREVVIR